MTKTKKAPFAVDPATVTKLTQYEDEAVKAKSDVAYDKQVYNETKVRAYSEVIASLIGVKLIKGNLPTTVRNTLIKALTEDAGIGNASAKRYQDISVAAIRCKKFDFPTQATAAAVHDELLAKEIKTEAGLKKFSSNVPPVDAMHQLAEKLIGKFTKRKDDDGNVIQGVFKPSKFDAVDWARFYDHVEVMKAARLEGEEAAKEAAKKKEEENVEINDAMDAIKG
jgi:hypothetical protein